GVLLQVRDLYNPKLFRSLAAHGQGGGIVETPRFKPFEIKVFSVPFFNNVEHLLRIAVSTGRSCRCFRGACFLSLGKLLIKNGNQRGTGVLEVRINVSVEQRFVDNERTAKVQVTFDREAFVLKQLGNHLTNDQLLSNILRSDTHRRLVVLRECSRATGQGSCGSTSSSGSNEFSS